MKYKNSGKARRTAKSNLTRGVFGCPRWGRKPKTDENVPKDNKDGTN